MRLLPPSSALSWLRRGLSAYCVCTDERTHTERCSPNPEARLPGERPEEGLPPPTPWQREEPQKEAWKYGEGLS